MSQYKAPRTCQDCGVNYYALMGTLRLIRHRFGFCEACRVNRREERMRAEEKTTAPLNWDKAACVGEDPRMWDTDFPAFNEAGREICRTCPIRELCLQRAMDSEGAKRGDLRSGIWGGLDPWERAALDRKQRTW